MSKELITIGSAVGIGALSKGVSGMIGNSPVINGIFGLVSGYAATKITGNTTGQRIMRGGAIGVAVVQTLECIKGIVSSPTISAKMNPETAVGRFLQKATGLSGAENELSGYFDEQGNYIEGTLNFSPDGNIMMLNAGDEEELYGIDDEELFGVDDEELFGIDEEELFGVDDEELFGTDDEEFLSACHELGIPMEEVVY